MRRSARMNTVVAIKGTFDANFPELTWLPKKGDRVPGRELAELITEGLRQRGFDAEDVSYEEPFFTTRCQSGDYRYEVLSYIYVPAGADAVWAVDCAPTLGTWAKLTGKSEEAEHGAVLIAIHDTLKKDARVIDMRWFKDLPGEPFSVQKYGRSPTDVPWA
jgi:hypothetical protein